MPSPYATKLAEAFSQKVIKAIYENAPIEEVVNRDYEGEIDAVGSKLNMLNFTRLSEKTYTGANLTADDLTEVNSQLVIDQYKSFYWKEKTINKWQSYIKEPKGTIVEQTANERKKNIMTFLLGLYTKAAAGSWYGTDYTTGTVAVTATTGAVVGSGTTFTAAMVGRPFRATGHTKWYRISAFADTTHITIVNDTDDDTAGYDGGTIASSTSYTIQAATVKTVDNSSVKFLDMVTTLKQRLDENEVPEEGRFLFIPPAGATAMLKDPGIKLNVPAAYEDLVVKGMITELEGFKVFKSNRLTGDNTNGYYVLAGQTNFITFADKALEVGMEEDLIGNFGSAYKDLFVYGAKVADERRKFGATAFVNFTA
jgi:hypothetical protein